MSAKSRYNHKPKQRKPVHYATQLQRLFDAGIIERGKVHQVDVAHDSWCPKLRDKGCGCNARIHLTPVEAR